MNKGTTKIKAISKRALEIREKAGFTTETIVKKRYKMAYVPDAIKQAAKELKTPGTAKRTKRVVKTKIAKNSLIAKRKVKRTGTNSKTGVKVVNKNVSISVQTAINDVLTLPKYSKLKKMYAATLFNEFKDTVRIGYIDNSTLKGVLLSQLEDIDYLNNDGKFYRTNQIARSFIKSVKARIETLKGKKYGYELFDN